MKALIIILVSFFALTSCSFFKKFTSEKENAVKEKTISKKDEPANIEADGTKPDPDSKTESVAKTDDIIMKEFDKKNLPSGIKFSGNIVDGKRWVDKSGENILILTETGKKKGSKQVFDGEYTFSSELFGYHFLNMGGDYILLWKVNDFIKDCGFDLTLNHINNSLSITDLNKNGIGESTFLYRMSCRSDVSPSELKLMMHEGSDKYALRGRMYINMQEMKEGGEYKVDKSFDSAPAGFLDYAKSQWREYREEKFN